MTEFIVVPFKAASVISLMMLWAMTLEHRFSAYREAGMWILRHIATPRSLAIAVAVLLLLMFF